MANVRVGDLADVRPQFRAASTPSWRSDNVLDVFDDAERRRVLRELWSAARARRAADFLLAQPRVRRRPAHGGRWPAAGSVAPGRCCARRPHARPGTRPGPPRGCRSGFATADRLAPLERRERDHAIVNDEAHDYALLHYYIRRDDQARQLAELGYALIECLDADGHPVPAGERSASPWLHYVARPAVSK